MGVDLCQPSGPVDDPHTPRGQRIHASDTGAERGTRSSGSLRAIKAWTTWLVDDGTLTEDPLASLPFVKPPKPHPDRTPVAELADMEAQLATLHEQLARRCP